MLIYVFKQFNITYTLVTFPHQPLTGGVEACLRSVTKNNANNELPKSFCGITIAKNAQT